MDSFLVDKAKNGDTAAFSELYEQVADDLYRVALYTLGNTADAEDVVSEAFIEAFRYLHTLRDNGAFKAWIMRILSVRCRRRIKQYISDRKNLPVEELPPIRDEKATELESLQAGADITSAMAILSPVERQIVLLSVLQGYTIREIAGMVRLPQGTVSSKLCRALKKLREKLEQ